MTVPFAFANLSGNIALAKLDSNFNTPITIGNTSVLLGNTVTTLNNLTLANVTITSGTSNVTNVNVTNITVTNLTATLANVTTLNASSASITSANIGTLALTNPLSVPNGGTGQVTFPANSVLVGNGTGGIATVAPGNVGNVLTSIGGAWVSNVAMSGAAAGANTQVQYNNSGVLAGSANLVFDGTNVGIGTTSPSQKLHLSVSSATGIALRIQNSAGNTYLSTQTDGHTELSASDASGYITFMSGGGTERMRLDSSGNLLVGKTVTSDQTAGTLIAPTYIFATRDGAAPLNLRRLTSDGDVVTFFSRTNGSSSGTISITSTTTAYNTSSDYRLKENIQPMQNALEKVAALKPVSYTWKENGGAGEGFIAHELQAVVPDCVTGKKDAVDEEGNAQYQGIDTSFLVATLTAAIQEQQALIQSLADRVTQLEAK
jgi:hypothetical protein